jgi:hypothetical protein
VAPTREVGVPVLFGARITSLVWGAQLLGAVDSHVLYSKKRKKNQYGP